MYEVPRGNLQQINNKVTLTVTVAVLLTYMYLLTYCRYYRALESVSKSSALGNL